MPHDFATEEDLLDRLTAQSHDVVYLVGSALTAPAATGEPGVPRVDGVIAEIRSVYTKPDALARFDKALADEPSNRYQAAFRFLQRTRGQDLANAIIRRCVLRARVTSARYPQVHADVAEVGAGELCRSLEQDLEGWHLPPAVRALGQILAQRPAETRPVVLTSNFDPLVTVSVHRAGGRAFTTALHSDGGFAAIDGHGTLVVHFHGDWFRSDTLHTPAQLGQDRPRLAASLAQLLSARTLVVLGYGGWDDIFTRSLVSVIRGELAPIDVLWTFRGADEAALADGYKGLLSNLGPGIERARVLLYKGIDAHAFLPKLAESLAAPVVTTAPVTTQPPVTPPTTRPVTGEVLGTSNGTIVGAIHVDDPGDSTVHGRVGDTGSWRIGDSAILGPVDPRTGQGTGPRPGDGGKPPGPGDSNGRGAQPGPGDSNGRGARPGPEDSGSAGGMNPFQKAGALALDAASYVRRGSDDGLKAALAEYALIAVRGEFSSGKSSLLLRAERYWGRAEAAVCRLDLMDMRIDDVNLFYDEFFRAVGECYGQEFTGWREVTEAAQARPLLLTLDEFSGLTPDVAQRFVPALHRLGTRLREQIRIVVTTRDPFEVVLGSFHLNNPNLGDWHTVEIAPLSEAELAGLLGHLGPRARAATQGQLDAVRRHSGMMPKPVQCLGFNLWKDEAAGKPDAELAARVGRKESYR
jgi:hypothetical protein